MDDVETILRRHGIDCELVGRIEGPDGELARVELVVPGMEALATWSKLRAIVAETGCWPVILGDTTSPESDCPGMNPDLYAKLTERQYPCRKELAEILAAAESETLDPSSEPARNLRPWFTGDALRTFLADPHREWQGEVSIPDFSFDELPQAQIFLLPTRNGWEAPAFLKWGGWNDCPYPEQHVARLKRWHEVYGAEVVGIIDVSTVYLYVSRPPQRRQDALLLAKEHLHYGEETILSLASSLEEAVAVLQASRHWLFWWD